MSNITDFHPLILPHLDGDREGEWCTFSANDGMVYLLNDNRRVVADIGEMSRPFAKEIHFATESECHMQAADYYTRYGEIYPYMKEWGSAMWDVDAVTARMVESQVMEFI